MVDSERFKVRREDSQRGLRTLIRRSRRALHLLSETLRQQESDEPVQAQAPAAVPPNEQLTEAIELAQALHSRFALLEQRFALLSDKVELLSTRLNEPVRRSEAEGTLRPPKVPQELEVTPEPRPSAPEFHANAYEPPAQSRQHSGFGVRNANAENLRPTRNGSLGPLLAGNITGLSLSSLFSLFEFDKSSGSLTIQHGGRRLDLLLRGGRVVRCELDGVRTAATASVREAFAWPESTFTFRRDPEQDDVEPPQSVNALMLDAMRFHDEELRTG
jgi:Domain of unknown function (DUF4388)